MRTRDVQNAAGVGRRALRLYEEKGLIRPRRGVGNRYREFDADTLARLHRVRLLQAIGLSLAEIGRLLDGTVDDWVAALALQEEWLRRRFDETRTALDRVRAARASVAAGRALGASEVLDLIAAAAPRDGDEPMKDLYEKHYSPAVREALARHPATPEEIRAGEEAWAEVMAEAERLKNTDPAAPEAQALVARWDGLIRAFTQGNAEVEEGLASLWADRGNWPDDLRQRTRTAADPAVGRFLDAARRAARDKA